jgi:nucleoid DNA-binding protein
MNVEDLTTTLAARHGFTKAFASQVLATVLETIRTELKAGRPVKIRNFGTFEARTSYTERRAKFDDSPNFFR